MLRRRVQTGAEALVGMRGKVVEACEPDGRVRVRGELWNATSAVPVAEGGSVTVTAVDGLTLTVEPAAVA
jgi:membrane-bound serine protease (ClpP class)